MSLWQRLRRLSLTTSAAEARAAGYAMAVLGRGSRPRRIAFVLDRAGALLEAGRLDDALAMYREVARAGDHSAVVRVVNWPGIRDDNATVEAVYRQAIAAGDLRSLVGLAQLRERLGDAVEACRLFLQGDEIDDPAALMGYGGFLARTQSRSESAEAVLRYRRQAAAGDSHAFAVVGAFLLRSPGGQTDAEAVLRQGAALLDNRSRSLLAALLLNRGAVEEASQLIARLRATGTEYIRAYVEELAHEYEIDPVG